MVRWGRRSLGIRIQIGAIKIPLFLAKVECGKARKLKRVFKVFYPKIDPVEV
jgi:hypothetical protein